MLIPFFQRNCPVFMGVMLLSLVAPESRSAEPVEWPHFQEVLRLIRANLDGINEEELNRAVVQGLLEQLHPRVILVKKDGADATPDAGAGRIARTTVFEKYFGYLRIERVGAGLGGEVAGAYERLAATNKLKGLVLDLRFCGGLDFRAAADAADRFLAKEKPLLDWGEGSAKSKAKEDAISLPLTVLVNRQTRGAAEALAAALRESGAALLIGANTAGEAAVFKDFDLPNGQKLRIATGPVMAGDSRTLSPKGVEPDIAIEVAEADEQKYFADAFLVLASAGSPPPGTNLVSSTGSTNRPRRINEAELVRIQREGLDLDDMVAPTNRVAGLGSELVVRDPALARALDLLKGITIVERFRRP